MVAAQRARQERLAAEARARLAAEAAARARAQAAAIARQRAEAAQRAKAQAAAAAAAAAAHRAATSTTTTTTAGTTATTTTAGTTATTTTTGTTTTTTPATSDPRPAPAHSAAVAPPVPTPVLTLPSLPPVSASASIVVGGHPQAAQVALQYIGVPYVWGGASPSGFDCSGLVSYVFAQLGVTLPHYAADQYTYGVPVDQNQLQPGDLVFFDALNHVGIYIGNGQYVDAPDAGSFVRIDSLTDPWAVANYVGARRV
jgi:cell wall-associated NlpC family hydrolase